MTNNYNQYVSEQISIGNQNLMEMKNLLLCGDINYLKYVGVTLTSIVINNPKDNFAFHIICDGINESDLEKFKATYKRYNCTINIYILDANLIERLSKTVNTELHVNVATLFRLVGLSILPNKVEKCLYLDSDILVSGYLNAFFNEEMSDCVAIVIEDIDSEMHKKNIDIQEYFNAGVMFIDVSKWKLYNLTARSLELLFSGKKWDFMDQDVLNLVLNGKIKMFPDRFNYMYRLNYTAVDRLFNNDKPVIWHFISISKPWHEWTQEFEIVKQYNEIVRNSFWADNKIVSISDINNLKIKYKVYKIISRKCREKGDFIGFIINGLKYGVLKLKYRFRD